MQLRIRNLQDFWSGIFFIALGVLAIYLSRDYPMGSALQPGPGYFPTWLGGIMIAFGVVIGGLSFKLAGRGRSRPRAPRVGIPALARSARSRLRYTHC